VAVVSAAGARQLWPGEDPVGKVLRLNIGEPGTRVQVADTIKELRKPEDFAAGSFVVTVVGVAKDVVSGFVYSGPDSAHLYFPTSPTGSRAAALMVRRPAGTSVQALKAVLRQAHPDPLAFDVLAMNEMVALQMFPLRAASWIATFLSAVALALSISGLYGVLTYTFGQRTREIGIRMALGAKREALLRSVLGYGLKLTGIGLAAGLAGALALTRLMETLLFEVRPTDPVTLVSVAAMITLVAIIASFVPAHRATRVDPIAALREE
jgi:ABC-type antimicrobial peptide transport system permease subunit